MSPRCILANPSTRSHQMCLAAIFSSCHPEPAPFAGEGSAFSFLCGTAIPRCALGRFHVCEEVDFRIRPLLFAVGTKDARLRRRPLQRRYSTRRAPFRISETAEKGSFFRSATSTARARRRASPSLPPRTFSSKRDSSNSINRFCQCSMCFCRRWPLDSKCFRNFSTVEASSSIPRFSVATTRITVEKFRKHFESSGQRRQKHIEHWQNRLIELLESRLLEKVLGGKEGEARLRALAVEVAERKKDPFSAVSEILKGAKLT